MAKVKANYPHQVGDIVDLYGYRFYKNSDNELVADIDDAEAELLISEEDCEIINA